MSQGGHLPPLPPLTPPTPTTNTPLTAQLQAAGRRAGLRAAILSKFGSQGNVKTQATQLSGE